jgi:phage-related protein
MLKSNHTPRRKSTPLVDLPTPSWLVAETEASRDDWFIATGRHAYVVSLEKAIYVSHACVKKSKSGIGIPKPDVELIEARLKRAHAVDAEE